MRDFGKGKILNDLNIKPHNIIITYTEVDCYDESRCILLHDIEGLGYDEFLVLEGGHCSCYGFDETEWSATVYKDDELKTLANAPYNEKSKFWQMVKSYV